MKVPLKIFLHISKYLQILQGIKRRGWDLNPDELALASFRDSPIFSGALPGYATSATVYLILDSVFIFKGCMKTIYLLTSNPGKVEEIKLHLKKFGIDVVAEDMEIPEIKSDNQEDIAIEKVKFAAKKIKKPVITEDTGIYFEAYKNFPGTNSRWVFETVGYEGILKLLEDKIRKAYFKTTIGFCEPGEESKVFVGICRGEITNKLTGNPHPRLPYDAIFIPEGDTRTFAEMTKEEKNKFSHRAKAVEKFAEWFAKT